MKTQSKRDRLKARLITFVKAEQEKNDSPTWKQVARRFKLNYATIEELITETEGVLDEVVGLRAGGGIIAFETKGQYQIEYCGEG